MEFYLSHQETEPAVKSYGISWDLITKHEDRSEEIARDFLSKFPEFVEAEMRRLEWAKRKKYEFKEGEIEQFKKAHPDIVLVNSKEKLWQYMTVDIKAESDGILWKYDDYQLVNRHLVMRIAIDDAYQSILAGRTR